MKFLSDMDYGLNRETGKYTVPCVEWDGTFGKYWVSFDSEEDRHVAIMDNQRYNDAIEAKKAKDKANYKRILKRCKLVPNGAVNKIGDFISLSH